LVVGRGLTILWGEVELIFEVWRTAQLLLLLHAIFSLPVVIGSEEFVFLNGLQLHLPVLERPLRMARGILTGLHGLQELPETLGHPDSPFLKGCELVEIQPVVNREHAKYQSDGEKTREEFYYAIVRGGQTLQIVEVVLLSVDILL